MNQGVPNRAVRAPNAGSYFVAIAAAISVLLIVSFSTRPPWTDPPKAKVKAAAHKPPIFHVQPQDRALGSVDSIVASQAGGSSGNRNLEARGWAVSCIRSAPLTTVIILVDGKPAGETKSFSLRPDVAKAYARPDFESSGWKISSLAGPLSPGDHMVTLRAVLANGESMDLPGTKLTIH
jgi:hypothetical protein